MNISYILKKFQEKDNKYYLLLTIQALVGGVLPLINVIMPKFIIQSLQVQNIQLSILLCFVLCIGNFLNQSLVFYINAIVEHRSDKLVEELRFDLLESYNKKEFIYGESKKGQDELEEAMFGYGRVKNLCQVINILLTKSINSIFNIVILISYDFKYMFVILFGSMLSYFLFGKQMEIEKKHADDLIKNNRILNYFMMTSKDSRFIKDIIVNNAQEFMSDKSKSYLNNIIKSNKKYSKEKNKISNYLSFINQMQVLVMLLLLSKNIYLGQVKLANFVLIFNSFIQVQKSLEDLIVNANDVEITENIISKFVEFLKDNEDNKNSNDEYFDMERFSDIEVVFDNVWFKYPNSQNYVLKGVSFKIGRGQHIALVGENGAGKSTIIKLLCKFYEPDKGKIFINNIDLTKLSKEKYYSLLSTTFQNFKLFPVRISENVFCKCVEDISDEEMEKFWNLSETLRLDEWLNKLESKQNTFVGKLFSENGVEPSLGLSQKLAIFRSMLHDGNLIIMDEPTASLDPKSEKEIFELVENIIENRTTIFVTHRLSASKIADEIIVLENGKIVEKGSHDFLILNDGLYKKLYELQKSMYI